MERLSLQDSVIGLPGAGRRTLLALLPEELRLPAQVRVCVLDAARPDGSELSALLDGLRARPELRPVFVLNKADLPVSLRPALSRALGALREQGFARAELYPLCAEAARLFLLPTQGRELSGQDQADLARAYDRFGPGENSLSGFAVTPDLRCSVGGREVSPEQLRLALENTGLPALRSRLEELAANDAQLPAPGAAPAAPAARQTADAPARQTSDAPAPEAAKPLPRPDADMAQWLAAISRTGFDDLQAMEATLRRLPVNEGQSRTLLEALSRRRYALEQEKMDALLAGAEQEDCAGLLRLAQQIRASDSPDEIRENGLKELRRRYEARELTELRELTLDADRLELPELQELIGTLNAGPYSAQTRAPYLELLQSRARQLHRDAMEELCKGCAEADRPALDRMRERIEARSCEEEIKAPYLERIALREDALDLQQLEALTRDCDTMSLKDLDCLAVTLQADNWNHKFVGRFRHKVALSREAALYRQVQANCAQIGQMERGELLALQQELEQEALPARFTAEPLARADERLYRLDMLRLLALEQDFDRLDFAALDTLRQKVLQGDHHERARQEYLSRLQSREKALIYAYAAPRAALTQQLAAQFRVKQADLSLSTSCADYDSLLAEFWGGTGLEQPRDIPVFLLRNAATLGFSGSRFWYKTGKSLAFLPLEEIERFQGFRQMLTVNLQVVRKDNTYLLTDAKLHRFSAESVLDFLNECLKRWQERAVPEGVLPPAQKTPAFLPARFAAPPEPKPLSHEQVLEILQAQYAAGRLKDGVLQSGDEAAWQAKTAKLMQLYGLPERTPVVWYYAPSILGSGKEGVAVGPGGIYVKEPRQSARIVPMEDIADLARAGSRRLLLTTVTGPAQELELPAAMEAPLRDYIRGIQLSRLLRQQKAAPGAESAVLEAEAPAPEAEDPAPEGGV